MSNPARPAVDAIFAAINSGDLSEISTCVTSDFVDHGSPFPLEPGPDGYTSILTYVTQVLRLQYVIADVIETPDSVVVRAVANGHGVAQVHGPAAADRPYAMSTIHIYRSRGDRLCEHWGVRDEVGAMIQMGLIPAPDPAAFAQFATESSR